MFEAIDLSDLLGLEGDPVLSALLNVPEDDEPVTSEISNGNRP